MQNGNLGNEQRKAIVKLVESTYNRMIDKQRRLYDETMAQVTSEIKAELGVAQMDDELKGLKQRIIEIETEKERLGFSKYNDVLILNSEAKRLVDEGVTKEKQLIAKFQADMDKAISEVWLAQERSQIQHILDFLQNEQ